MWEFWLLDVKGSQTCNKGRKCGMKVRFNKVRPPPRVQRKWQIRIRIHNAKDDQDQLKKKKKKGDNKAIQTSLSHMNSLQQPSARKKVGQSCARTLLCGLFRESIWKWKDCKRGTEQTDRKKKKSLRNPQDIQISCWSCKSGKHNANFTHTHRQSSEGSAGLYAGTSRTGRNSAQDRVSVHLNEQDILRTIWINLSEALWKSQYAYVWWWSIWRSLLKSLWKF